MRARRIGALAMAAMLATGLSACSDDGGDDDDAVELEDVDGSGSSTDDTATDDTATDDTDASDDDVIEAAKAAYVDRFVHTLPKGYETRVNDAGSNISAGERQLITIARAFLARPQLLILDEATSSVDTLTELLIAKATHELRRDRTSFLIAHRLSTIRDADVILVMESGKIVEQGNHSELLARRGAYYAMTRA